MVEAQPPHICKALYSQMRLLSLPLCQGQTALECISDVGLAPEVLAVLRWVGDVTLLLGARS